MHSLKARIATRLKTGCIESGATVRGNVTIGRRVMVSSGARIIANGHERITVGDDCSFMQGVMLLPYGGWIQLGDRVGINAYSALYGHGGLTIGNDVMIATGCVITPGNHRFERLDIPMNIQGIDKKGIRIEDDVWLGAHAVVLDGVTIGRGAVIGASAVVNTDIPPYAIAVGVPARQVGDRREGTKGTTL
jgi:acetyltransferase-like isoleucine patch superfamily enzyme